MNTVEFLAHRRNFTVSPQLSGLDRVAVDVYLSDALDGPCPHALWNAPSRRTVPADSYAFVLQRPIRKYRGHALDSLHKLRGIAASKAYEVVDRCEVSCEVPADDRLVMGDPIAQ